MNAATRTSPSRGPLPAPRREVFCPVVIATDLYGLCDGFVRCINRAGVFLEVSFADLLPLGTVVKICFTDGAVSIVVTIRVQQHHFINYAARGNPNALAGMTARFVSVEAGERQLRPQLH